MSLPNNNRRLPTAFDDYVEALAALLRTSSLSDDDERVTAALDGEVGRRLRASVPLQQRRNEGAFFTSRALAERLVAGDASVIASSDVIADVACGAGDLLLATAQYLDVDRTVPDTLRAWGQRLVGRDLNPAYVRTTRLRLALLARARTGHSWRPDEAELEELLPEIRAGDGTAFVSSHARTVAVLNPPFGSTVSRESWGSGRISRAGVFTRNVVEQLPPGAAFRAILPDVLRSGTNYRRWREHMERRLTIERIEPIGQFDPWTDVDVFLLAGVADRCAIAQTAEWWLPVSTSPASLAVQDRFEVRVGTVVPHRDAEAGGDSPYLRARDIPQHGEHRAGSVRRRHRGRRFRPPFVVIRRTSRPEPGRPRVVATVATGDEPVLVENHLLVCVPHDGRLESCRRLITSLTTEPTTDWLNQRLRCRHLTVGVLRELPLSGWETT